MASIYSSLASLLFAHKYSDLTITCGGRTFPVHKAVVCSQSAFFAKACDNNFKESISGVVNLPEDDPHILERFLLFLYTGNYEYSEYPVLNKPSLSATTTPVEVREEIDQADSGGHGDVAEMQSRDATRGSEDGDGENDESDGDYGLDEDSDEDKEQSEIEYNDFDESGGGDYTVDSLFTSLRVYVMADKFDVPALKLLARERFYRMAENIYTTCEAFPAVIDEMYCNTLPTDIAMREIACRLIAEQYNKEEALRERILPIMRKHGDLAVGVLHYMMWHMDDDTTKSSPSSRTKRNVVVLKIGKQKKSAWERR